MPLQKAAFLVQGSLIVRLIKYWIAVGLQAPFHFDAIAIPVFRSEREKYEIAEVFN